MFEAPRSLLDATVNSHRRAVSSSTETQAGQVDHPSGRNNITDRHSLVTDSPNIACLSQEMTIGTVTSFEMTGPGLYSSYSSFSYSSAEISRVGSALVPIQSPTTESTLEHDQPEATNNITSEHSLEPSATRQSPLNIC